MQDVAVPLLKKSISLEAVVKGKPASFKNLVHEHRGDVDTLIVAGGDGTLRRTLEIVLEHRLRLAVLPAGTANNFARNLGLPLNLEEACGVIAREQTRQIDVGMVNGKPFLNVSGLGLSTHINREISHSVKQRWGILSYIIYLFKVMRRTRPFLAEIECDGRLQKVKSLQITICNGRHYGAGMIIAEDASISDARLDLCSLQISGWWEGLKLLPSMMRGRYPADPGVLVLQGREMKIRTRRSMAVDTDGEVITHTPAHYIILPKALTVIAPPEAPRGRF